MTYLTSLRGIAAFLVLLFHLKTQMYDYDILKSLSFIYSKGYLAVDFFFILSGFIISYSYYSKFTQNLRKGELKIFILKRVARILPLHLFAMLLFLLFPIALFLSGRDVNADYYDPVSYLLKLTLIDLWAINTEHWNSWNFPSWTISGEWFAYLLFPFFAFFYPSGRKMIILLFSLLLLNLAFWYHYFSYETIGQGIGRLGLLRCTSGFFIGFCVYHFVSYWKNSISVKLGNLSLLSSIIVTILLGAMIPENYFFVPFCFAWILFSFVVSDTFMHQILNKRWLVYLGDISYSLYLMHIFIITSYATIFWNNDLKANLIDIPIIISLCILTSHITYKYIEKPARHKITNRFTKLKNT